ncbi:MAG: hypothetical protein RBS77_06455 [Candidatus Moranbacteria bacterium]|jgi:hypothetical protein|nr:hypothetical protein [Candidatus Moranbacteria bacterium]
MKGVEMISFWFEWLVAFFRDVTPRSEHSLLMPERPNGKNPLLAEEHVGSSVGYRLHCLDLRDPVTGKNADRYLGR